ncbi:MAG TPA: hypothetical protein VEC13_01800, partial [Candidatus Paceibacterota bacterium]|nr:hypothetical protein [Candidatus Paceibacterota bacterium]
MKNKQIVFVVLGLLGLGLAGLGVWSVSNNDWNRGRGFGFFRDDNSYINNFYENTYGFSFVYPDTFELGMFCGIDDTEIVREISISSTDPLDAGINEIACLYVRNGKEKLGVGDPMYVGNSEATVYVYSLAGADYRKYEISLGNNRYLYFNTLDQYFTRSKVSLEGTDYYDHFLELADGIEMIISNLYLDDPLQSSAASNSLD